MTKPDLHVISKPDLELRNQIAEAVHGVHRTKIYDQIDEQFGPDEGCGGTLNPCGGCKDCAGARPAAYMPTPESFLPEADAVLAAVSPLLAAKDTEIAALRRQLAWVGASRSTNKWVAVVELARITQLARTTTEMVDEWDAGRQHVLELIERRLAELRGPRKPGVIP